MKRYIILLLGLLLAGMVNTVSAQTAEECKWTYSVKVLKEGEAQITFKATVADGWHLYSQKNPPNPLEFEFVESPDYKRKGKVAEPKPKKVYEPLFESDVYYFETHTVRFTQDIRINTDKPFEIRGKIYGQVCMDDGVCKPIQEEFLFKVDPSVLAADNADDADGDGIRDSEDACPDEAGPAHTKGCPDNDNDLVPDHLDKCPTKPGSPDHHGCPDSDGDGVYDDVDKCPGVAGDGEDGCVTQGEIVQGSRVMPQRMTQEAVAALSGEGECGNTQATEKSKSFWGIFVAGFIGGLLALLTPCVFPMIPLTVSFFTKQSKTRAKGLTNAFIYALSIILIYTLMGFLITQLAGPEALNAMATSAFWNLLFFAIFIVFAISFLGAFEITLPSRFVNVIDKQSNRTGLIGIFFMAFTLALVSFSCTGPIIGTLLVESAVSGATTGPLIGMIGFSTALALPFALFAAFPGWLNSLPKSGSWLATVKVVLGLLELALSLKFLSVVDMVYHWGILKREIFLALWIIIFLVMGIYLLGLLRFKDDHEQPRVSVPRLLFAIIALSFSAYMVPGLWGAPLKLLSGLAPPTFYREWNTTGNECPLGLECNHNDFDGGVAMAKAQDKPIMLDFTGWACTNCRYMEENVWSKPEISKILSEDVVVISLYVDDGASLPENAQVTSLRTGEKITNMGAKWTDFQIYYYNKTVQPQYVMIDPEGKLLTGDISYTDAATFKKFLEEGICRYKARKGAKGKK